MIKYNKEIQKETERKIEVDKMKIDSTLTLSHPC